VLVGADRRQALVGRGADPNGFVERLAWPDVGDRGTPGASFAPGISRFREDLLLKEVGEADVELGALLGVAEGEPTAGAVWLPECRATAGLRPFETRGQAALLSAFFNMSRCARSME
jgi:hypothetical protein